MGVVPIGAFVVVSFKIACVEKLLGTPVDTIEICVVAVVPLFSVLRFVNG